MFHLLRVGNQDIEGLSFETDRMRFVGRGATLEAPLALTTPGVLSGSQGSVLDPIVAIRCRITLQPRRHVTLDFITGIGKEHGHCGGLED